MNELSLWLEQLLERIGLTGTWLPLARMLVMVAAAAFLAALAGWICHKLLVPVIMRITQRTAPKWDDVIINSRVLLAACQIVPAIVVWLLLPMVFFEYPALQNFLGKLTSSTSPS